MRRAARRAATVLGLCVLQVTVVSIASASSLTVISQTLAVGTVTAPAFFASSVATTNTGKAGTPTKNDTVTLGYSKRLLATSLCAGASNVLDVQTFTGVTIVLADGGGIVEDTLAVTAGPLTCLVPNLGVLGLGAAGYAVGVPISFTASSLRITQTATSATVLLTLGNPSSNAGTFAGASVVTYAPAATLMDSTGALISSGTASSTSVRQF